MIIKSLRFISLLACYVPVVYSQDYSGTTINSQLMLGSGDTIVSSTVADQGRLTLNGNAQSNNITVSSGGAFEVNKDATDDSSTIKHGAIQTVAGLASNTRVEGEQTVSGRTENVTIDGGYQSVYGSGVSEGTSLINGGTQYVTGTVNNTKVDSSTQHIQIGGSAKDTYLSGTGIQNVDGKSEGSRLGNNSSININAGGKASDINGYDNTVINVNSHGIATDIYIREQSTINIDAYGEANNIQTYDNNVVNVKSHGNATDIYLREQSTLNIDADGAVTGGVAYDNSIININNGTVTDLLAYDNGAVNLNSGSISGFNIYDDGKLSINSGSATNGLLYDNASAIVDNGGVINDVSMYDNSALDVKTGGSVSDVDLRGNSILSLNGGSVDGANFYGGTFNANAGEVVGNYSVSDGNMRLGHDADSQQANITVGSHGILQLAKDNANGAYSLNNLHLSNGTVSFYDKPINKNYGWNTLQIGELSGTGQFYMHTDVSALKGDLLNVTGQASGSFNIFVEDTGVSPTTDHSLVLVKTASGNATFALGNQGGVVDLGTWEYTLKEETKGSWALTPDLTSNPNPNPGPNPTPDPNPNPGPNPTPDPNPTPGPNPTPDPNPNPGPGLPPEQKPVVPLQPANIKKRITPSTAAVLNMAAVEPLVFDAELESVRERLDNDTAFSRDGAVWGTYLNARNDASTSAGAGFDQTLNGMTLGFDRTLPLENSAVTTGGFFSYSHSNVGFDRGGKGDVDSYSLGAYAGWQHNNGLYVDGIVKVNRFENDVKGRMTSGGAANGNYSAYGAGAHLESGMRLSSGNLAVTPYAAFTGFTTDSNKYTLSNGMRADVDNTRSLRVEAGLKTDYSVTLDNGVELQPWLKASVRQEYADNNAVKVNNDGHFVNDQSGTRGVYRAGIRAKFTENLSGQLSASYGNGAGVESPWSASAGISWSF